MLEEQDFKKVAHEINTISSKIAQEKYNERAKTIIKEINQELGQDFSEFITVKRGKYKIKDNKLDNSNQ